MSTPLGMVESSYFDSLQGLPPLALKRSGAAWCVQRQHGLERGARLVTPFLLGAGSGPRWRFASADPAPTHCPARFHCCKRLS